MSHIFNEKSDVIWSDDEDGADGNRGDEDDCEKKQWCWSHDAIGRCVSAYTGLCIYF